MKMHGWNLWWLVLPIVVASVSGVAAHVHLSGQPAMYEARGRLLVGSLSADFDGIRAGQALAPTYVELATSEALLARAITSSRLDVSVAELRRTLSVVTVGTSRIILISARHEDPDVASGAVGAVSQALQRWDAPSRVNLTVLDDGGQARAVESRSTGLVVLASIAGAGLAVGALLLRPGQRVSLGRWGP
jgi:capsular polysaccharide biosynthesis protein